MAMKLVCYITISGVDTLKTLTTVGGADEAGVLQNANFVKTKPGIGKPYLMFATLPGSVVAADFDGGPIVSADVQENVAAINAMLANPPLDRLTFA